MEGEERVYIKYISMEGRARNQKRRWRSLAVDPSSSSYRGSGCGSSSGDGGGGSSSYMMPEGHSAECYALYFV